MKWKNRISALLRGIGVTGLLLLVVIYLPLLAPRFFGLKLFAITSGSMEPEIPVGSIVIVQKADPALLETGSVISFQSSLESQGTVTHRILENHSSRRELITKGDANPAEDLRPVPYGNVIGLVKLHLPYWGYLAVKLETFWGKLCALCLLAFFVLCCIAGNCLKLGREEFEQEE